MIQPIKDSNCWAKKHPYIIYLGGATSWSRAFARFGDVRRHHVDPGLVCYYSAVSSTMGQRYWEGWFTEKEIVTYQRNQHATGFSLNIWSLTDVNDKMVRYQALALRRPGIMVMEWETPVGSRSFQQHQATAGARYHWDIVQEFSRIASCWRKRMPMKRLMWCSNHVVPSIIQSNGTLKNYVNV